MRCNETELGQHVAVLDSSQSRLVNKNDLSLKLSWRSSSHNAKRE